MCTARVRRRICEEEDTCVQPELPVYDATSHQISLVQLSSDFVRVALVSVRIEVVQLVCVCSQCGCVVSVRVYIYVSQCDIYQLVYMYVYIRQLVCVCIRQFVLRECDMSVTSLRTYQEASQLVCVYIYVRELVCVYVRQLECVYARQLVCVYMYVPRSEGRRRPGPLRA